jgi:hypothetical protein
LKNSYLLTETNFLRAKLSHLKIELGLKKISEEEYNSYVTQILESISRNNELNEEEKQLLKDLKSKVMNKYEIDEGLNEDKIKNTLINN